MPTLALAALVCSVVFQEAVLDERHRFETRLRATPVLSELQFHVVEVPPFALYVERFLGEPPDHAERARARFGAHLGALHAELASTVLVVDHDAAPELFIPVVLLASAGSYLDFSRSRPNDLRDFGGGEYRHALRAAIGYQDVKGKARPVEEQLRPVLRDACMAWLAAHSPGEGFPRTHWLLSGLSWALPERVIARLRPAPTDGAEPRPALPIEPYFFDQVHTVLASPELRAEWWLPLAPIVDLDGRSRFFEWPQIAAEGRASAPLDAQRVSGAYAMFRSQAALLVAYLGYGADAALQAKFRAAAARGLVSGLRADVLAGELGLESVAQLEAPLLTWLNGLYAARGQAAVPLVSEVAPRVESPVSEAARAPAAEFDPGSLLPTPDNDEHRLAEALWLAQRGHERAALARLDAALEGASGPEPRARMARERARVAALLGAREAWLARVLAGDRCRLPVAGELRNVEVAALEDGALRFARPVEGVAVVPLEVVDARVLALNLARKDFTALAPPWVEGYALLLAGDDGWRRALRNVEGATEVLADAESILALAPIGRGYGLLGELALGGLPATVEDATRVLERIGQLRGDAAGVELVHARSAAVRQVALRALEVQAAAEGLAGLLRGKAVYLDGGRVRVEYSFDSELELLDFTRPAAVAGLPARLPEGRVATAKVDAGQLSLQGRVELRHVLALEAPCRLRVELIEPTFPAGAVEAPLYITQFSLLDDGAWTRGAACWGRDSLEVRNESFHVSESTGHPSFFQGSDRTVELRVSAAGRIELQVDATPVVACEHDGLGSGWTRILTEAPEPLRVKRIELEGVPTQASVDELVRSQALLRLAALDL